jgi:PEP-CTERM motif
MFINSFRLATFSFLLLTSAASAAVVVENPWNSAATNGGTFSQPSQQLASDFILATGATIDAASWHGTMFGADPLDTGDTWNFTFRIFGDAAGLPDVNPVHDLAVVANVIDTGIDIASERAYQFSVSFSPIMLSSGAYWLSIVNADVANTFRWTEATSGLNSSIRNADGDNWRAYTEVNRVPQNFVLTFDGGTPVPEPATMSLLLVGLASMGAARRRRG